MSTLRCFLSRMDLFLTTLIIAPNAESTIYYSVVDITGGTTTSRNLTNARLFGYEAELNYEACTSSRVSAIPRPAARMRIPGHP